MKAEAHEIQYGTLCFSNLILIHGFLYNPVRFNSQVKKIQHIGYHHFDSLFQMGLIRCIHRYVVHIENDV